MTGSGLWLRFLGAWVALSSAGAGEITVGPGDDWFSLINGSGLRPGDTVILKAGVYSDPRRLSLRHRGTAEAPITIRGQRGQRVVFKRPDTRQNTFNLEGPEFLAIRDLEITGGSSAIRISHPEENRVHNITLSGLHIHHIDGEAVTCNHPGHTYEKMHFFQNHIHHTGGHGEAFYLGTNNDRQGNTVSVFRDSIVEGNYIHHLNGPTVSQGDGIEVKDGSYGNTIRNNIIHDTKYPGITIYGTDANERNVIEGNVIWNTGQHGIQAAAEVVIRQNIIFDTGADGIRSQNHQSARVGDLEIIGNQIINARGFGIRIDTIEDPIGPVVIQNNVISASRPFRVPDNHRIRIEDNEIATTQPEDCKERLKRDALLRWQKAGSGALPAAGHLEP